MFPHHCAEAIETAMLLNSLKGEGVIVYVQKAFQPRHGQKRRLR